LTTAFVNPPLNKCHRKSIHLSCETQENFE